jgi:hypothetical protein
VRARTNGKKNEDSEGRIAKTTKFPELKKKKKKTPPPCRSLPLVELAPGPRARWFCGRARLRGELSVIRGSYHEKMKVQELAKASNWKPRPGLELAPESSSSQGTSWNHTSRGSGVRARNERKKNEDSEGRIAKRTKFPELQKKKKTPPPCRALPLVELAPGPRVEPPVQCLRWASSKRVRKNDEL